MLFTFKRDDEGRERIFVGDVCVAIVSMMPVYGRTWAMADSITGITPRHVNDAIERADEAGFWMGKIVGVDDEGTVYRSASKYDDNEVTVDVPVADSAVLPVTTDGEDFDGHLRRSTEVVSTWPAWKRGILGGGS